MKLSLTVFWLTLNNKNKIKFFKIANFFHYVIFFFKICAQSTLDSCISQFVSLSLDSWFSYLSRHEIFIQSRCVIFFTPINAVRSFVPKERAQSEKWARVYLKQQYLSQRKIFVQSRRGAERNFFYSTTIFLLQSTLFDHSCPRSEEWARVYLKQRIGTKKSLTYSLSSLWITHSFAPQYPSARSFAPLRSAHSVRSVHSHSLTRSAALRSLSSLANSHVGMCHRTNESRV